VRPHDNQNTPLQRWRQPALDTDAGRLWQAVQAFRNIDTKMMPLYTIQIFLAVALNQGISITELAQLVGVDQASATPNGGNAREQVRAA